MLFLTTSRKVLALSKVTWKETKNISDGVLFNRPEVIGFLHMYEGIVTKTFLLRRTMDFASGLRTATTVVGIYWEFFPFRIYNKVMFSGVVFFGKEDTEKIFPSTKVGEFLSEDAKLASTGTCPKLPGDLESSREKILTHSIPWILPFVRGNKVKEYSAVDDEIVEYLIDYHMTAGKKGSELDKMHLVENNFLNGRDSCPIPPTLTNVSVYQEKTSQSPSRVSLGFSRLFVATRSRKIQRLMMR